MSRQTKLMLADIHTVTPGAYTTPTQQGKPDSVTISGRASGNPFKRDLKKEYPGIIEYVKENNCSFTEAIRRLKE